MLGVVHETIAVQEVIVKETLPAMQLLKSQGKIRYIGITSYVLEKLVHVLVSLVLSCCSAISMCWISVFSHFVSTDAAFQQG